MSLSYFDRNLKLWNFRDWQCLINIKDILYSSGYLYSACIFNKHKDNYFAVSNYSDENINSVGSIKVYNFKNRYFKEKKKINDSNYNTLLIKAYINDNNIYIIACGDKNIRAYDYGKNLLYKKYEDNNMESKIFSFTIFQTEEKIKIISSCDDQYIRIWDFQSSEILKKIKINYAKLRGICLYNEKYLLVACGDKSIKLIEIENGFIIKSFNEHQEKVCTIKFRKLGNLGKCFISHGYDDHIILWNITD